MKNIKLQIVSDSHDEVKTAFAELGRRVAEQAEQMRPTIEKLNAIGKAVTSQVSPLLETWKSFQSNLFEKQIEVASKLAPVLQQIKEAQETRARFLASAMEFEPITYSPDVFIPRAPVTYRFIENVVIETIDKLGIRPNVVDGQLAIRPAVQLPEGARFEDIIISFSSDEDITVEFRGKIIGTFNCESLGFAKKNTSNKEPDKQWKLLKLLSVFEETKKTQNFSTVLTTDLLAQSLKVKKSAAYQTKKLLSKKLQAVFGIQDDPFMEYDEQLGYKLKFVLRPQSLLRDDGELHASGSQLYEETTEISSDDQY